MDQLASRRIFVVEDSPVVAEMLEAMLEDLGCDVVGPMGNLAIALEMAAGEKIDAAVIDLNIRGGKVFPVARTLAERGIPFLVVSGYGDFSMPEEWQDRPTLTKPFSQDALEAALKALLTTPVAS
jgi:CheY-like chemotaxis protein